MPILIQLAATLVEIAEGTSYSLGKTVHTHCFVLHQSMNSPAATRRSSDALSVNTRC